MSGRFAGQGWVVTGGTRGIGAAIAEAAEAEGATVVRCGRSIVEESDTHIRCDVTVEDDVERLFDLAEERLPSLDVVVSNAGATGPDKLLVQTSLDAWNTVMAANLRGAFLVSRRAVEEMLGGGGGRLVHVASFAAAGLAGQGAYAAAKAGLISMTRAIAAEYGRAGVSCNAVVPGYVDTAMVADLPAERRDALAATLPAKRFASPAEVAAAVLFLASEDASFVQGDALRVTAGVDEVPFHAR